MKGLTTTGIPYLDLHWPIATGCIDDKPCWKRCWARRDAHRWKRDFAPTFHPEILDVPLRTRAKAGTVIGVAFGGDLGLMEYEQIAATLGACACRQDLTFVILTKRPAALARSILRMDFAPPPREPAMEAAARLLEQEAVHHPLGTSGPIHCKFGPSPNAKWPLPNVFIGWSAWDQASFDKGLDAVVPLAKAGWRLWCSLEPMIGLVDPKLECVRCGAYTDAECPSSAAWCICRPPLSWVVVGGESGRGARPMHPDWARKVRESCSAARVPFAFKQWSEGGTLGGKGTVTRAVVWMDKLAMVPELDGRVHTATPWERG